MNTQMTRTHEEETSHNMSTHEHNPEKKSVLEKVKAKAKKMKDTVGHKIHGGHDHTHNNQYLDEEEDDDNDDDELEKDPEVHGAPMYESEAVGNFMKNENVNPTEPTRVNLSEPLEEDPSAPKIGRPSPGNYQTKVTDPTGAGGLEASIEPLIRSLGKMEVTNEEEPEQKNTSFVGTGSHDQFSPPDESSIGTKNKTEPENQSHTYTEKISSATSAIAGTAISAKNVVASKLGYGSGSTGDEMKKEGDSGGQSTTAVVSDYGRQIASTMTEKLKPVYEKVSEAGVAVVSKIPGSGTGSGTGAEREGKEQDKGVTVKGYLGEKLSPGEEDKALSGVISEALNRRKMAERMETGEKEGSGSGVGYGAESPGVVDRVKGAVSGWFGKGDQTRPTESSRSPDELKDGSEGGVR